ncbi:MAG: flagellar biosynthetic protein FliR [Candidatus Baltobacteraceae bacterium]
MVGLLVLARCAGFVSRAPGFSHPSVPTALRASLALLLALAIAPGLANPSHVTAGATLAVALFAEFIVGSTIGMAASLIYDGAYAGGRAIDDYVGVKAIAPSLQLVAPSGFGRIWSLAFTGGFFLTGAYRLILIGLATSFSRLPPGAVPHPHDVFGFAAAYARTIIVVALQVGGPAIGLAFVVQIAIGALSRAVPRFGSFMLAFPLAFAAALVATAIALPLMSANQLSPVIAMP